MALNVRLFRNFAEDHRESMEVYADGLSRTLRANFPDRCHLCEYRPRLLPGMTEGPWSMRLARYCAYPLQARPQQQQLNHIVDQGYGHLLYTLDPKRTVVTVHDIIPIIHWQGGLQGLTPGRKPWLNLFSFNALRRAAHLLADSDKTRSDLIRFCHCPPEMITVVYLGIDPKFRPYAPAEKLRARRILQLSGDGTHEILIMGSPIYKNQTSALKAFARLLHIFPKPLRLLKTGQPNQEWTQTIQQLGLNATTKCLGFVERDQLPSLYNSVDCLLFPSLYEGFGWPPLEAMACGTPVVTSNAGSLPEVIGDAGLVVGPQDYEGLARAMLEVLTNNELRQSLIAKGLKQAERFTWDRTAQQTLAVYERIIEQLKETKI